MNAPQRIYGPGELAVKSMDHAEEESRFGTQVQAEICERDELDCAEVSRELLYRAGPGKVAEGLAVHFYSKRGLDQAGDVADQGFGTVSVTYSVRKPISLDSAVASG